jgi:aminoglycoside phosphotransferase (APT) family kinase protein
MGPEWRRLQAAAHELDARLRATPFRTLNHGDFKAENLLFGGEPPACAAYDLQYCGGGSGTKDIAYLFTSALPARLLAQREGELLGFYHAQLLEGLKELAAGGGAGVGDPVAAADAVERYSFDAMLAEYKLALCDYVRFMAGCVAWLACMPQPASIFGCTVVRPAAWCVLVLSELCCCKAH